MEAPAQARFDGLRKAHYPPALNQIAAHLTLFHTLPADTAVHDALAKTAADTRIFRVQVTGTMFLGRGVALHCESPELMALHAALADAFREDLSAQDKQRFRPHVVVQNKATPADARALEGELRSGLDPWTFEATGLSWWDYLGGPWRLREELAFGD